MDAAGRRELISDLCSIERRYAGTWGELRAARLLSKRLESMGRQARLEATYVHPEYSLVLAAHALLALAGSLVALASAPVGFGLVLVAALSMYLDQNTSRYLIRRLFFRRASQNVVSPGRRPGAPARVVLSAHYDAAKTGFVFGPRSTRLARRLSESARVLFGPIRLIFWGGVTPMLPITGARMAGLEAQWLAALQLVPTMVLLVSIVLLIDIALSDVVPGAYDNASGVAAVLAALAKLDADPPENLDVWAVLPGAEECNCEGMAAWARSHRRGLDREKTFFVNLDSLSYGSPHYLLSEGAIVSYGMDGRLAQLCHAIATADREDGNRFDARPIRIPFHSDALPLTVRGFRAISLLGASDGVGPPYYHTPKDTPEAVDDDALTRSVEFTVELVRQLDRDVGRQL